MKKKKILNTAVDEGMGYFDTCMETQGTEESLKWLKKFCFFLIKTDT